MSSITYYPEVLWPELGIKPQAVSSADRPYCALTMALACWQADARGLPRKGSLRGPDLADITDPMEVGKVLSAAFREHGVSWIRANRWAESLRRHKVLDPVELITSAVDASGQTYTLDPYQIDAIAHMTPHGGIFDLDTGLGKTLGAVCYALTVVEQGFAAASRCWILAPRNASEAWSHWLKPLEEVFEDVRFVSVDSAHKLIGDSGDGGVLILDETHMLGGASTRRTRSVLEVRKSFDSALSATGTFLHGGIERTLSVLDIALPGAAVFSSRWKCGDRFKCLVRKNIGPRTVTELEKPHGTLRAEYFQYLSLFVVSQDKSDESIRAQIGLSGVDQDVVTEKIGTAFGQKAALDLWVASAIELAGGDPSQSPEAACNAKLEWPHASAVMHAMARQGIEQKIEWLATHMDDTDLPLVIFAHSLYSLDVLEAAFFEAGMPTVRVDGGVTRGRDDLIHRFQQGDVNVFLAQCAAAGVSMNLQCSCLSVAFDHGRDPTVYYQLLGRTYRRGQTRDCLHVDLVTNDLQVGIVKRLRDAQAFDASCSEWQRMKSINDDLRAHYHHLDA
jgi:superfamily II DNA or RNA helicase